MRFAKTILCLLRIITLDGDPLKDITAVRRVVFVMKGGIVYKNASRGRN